ncbi:hypothetical protein QOZ88_05905 [Blastococcus sp. BMG 814]|uniref:Zinc-ribbon domain-containing protein n=1 Tax=Blastococcus carthaginiensis TaxID=3050034 RepID=A0ABT9I9C7_9ACTN|nr:hypothetical protein [Blastococcus carthaginiensis]MDP5182164.1 hypothetical protein [Blastococcus carthaginiensis]
MPDLEAYRRSLQPHRHDWQPLHPDRDAPEWCPGCGAVRQRED